jgi:broad specificity phosphatase PhoE
MKHFFFSFLFWAFFISASSAQSSIFIVRHAEKAESDGNDPHLSKAGRVRADALARMLKDANITAIYATEFKRTQQTAAPLAKALDIEVTIRPAKATDFALKLQTTAGNVLVVGHSNTIPDLIKEFGINTPVRLGDNDYDDLFMIVLGRKARLVHLHYR